jgi:hypothetical protein
MKHKVPHSLGLERAKAVANAAWQSYAERFASYHPTLEWETEQRGLIGFHAKGVSLKGSLEIQPESFDLELEVPFLLKPFRGKAISVIEEEIRRWIDKEKAGQA